MRPHLTARQLGTRMEAMWGAVPPSGRSSGRRAVRTRPFAQGDVCEPLRVALASVNVSEDYQREGPPHVFVAVLLVHLMRDGLANPVEGGGHEGDSLGAVGAVIGNEMQHRGVLGKQSLAPRSRPRPRRRVG